MEGKKVFPCYPRGKIDLPLEVLKECFRSVERLVETAIEIVLVKG